MFAGKVDPPEYDPVALRKAQYMDALMFGRAPVGGPFSLTSLDGTRLALADFRGRVVLLYFGYTFCPDVCPTDLVEVKRVLDRLASRRHEVQVLFVTIDPERDTAQQLAAYLRHFDPGIVGLTGSVAEVRKIADSYKAYFEKVPLKNSNGYLMDHSANLYVIDREGRYRGNFAPGASAEKIVEVLQEFL